MVALLLSLFATNAYAEEIAVKKDPNSTVSWTLEKTTGYISFSHIVFDNENNKKTVDRTLFEYSGIQLTVRQGYLFSISSFLNLGYEKRPLGMYADNLLSSAM